MLKLQALWHTCRVRWMYSDREPADSERMGLSKPEVASCSRSVYENSDGGRTIWTKGLYRWFVNSVCSQVSLHSLIVQCQHKRRHVDQRCK